MGRPRFHGGRLVQFLIGKQFVILENDPGQCRMQGPDGQTCTVHHNDPDLAFLYAETILREFLGIDPAEFAEYLEGK